VVELFEPRGLRAMTLGIALALCVLGLIFSYSRMGLFAATITGVAVVAADLRRSAGRRRAAVLVLVAAGSCSRASPDGTGSSPTWDVR
jgi:hypothetical protein